LEEKLGLWKVKWSAGQLPFCAAHLDPR